MDTIYHRLSANYPNLKRIVLTGHSAGSQMVVRYAAAGGGRAMTQGTEINLFFVSINTPSFLYFDGNRVLDEEAETFDFGPTDCGTANQYKYGLENLNQYMGVIGENTIIENYMLSNVVYLIGQYDLGGQTNTCARMVQGNNRLIRTHIYFSYLGYYYGDTIYQNHKAAEIPSAYHEFDQVVFTDCGMSALFDIGDCGIYIDGTELFNHEPIAQAGPDQTINPLSVAQLDASGSYDVDGLIVSYNWEQISGLPINIQSSESLLAQFTMPDSGYIDIQLEVFDNEGAPGRDTTRFVVNSPPISNAGENQVVGFSQVVLLDGSESRDEEGEVSGFLWEQIGGEAVSLFSVDQEIATFYSPTTSGSLSFVLTVFDNQGLSDQDTTDVYVSSLSIKSKNNGEASSGAVLFPNPFNSALIIDFNGAQTKNVFIYDISGKIIKNWSTTNGQSINKQIVWRGKDERGFEIRSGLYFVRFQSGNYSIIKKVTYLK